jgi:hypothetical protein
MKITKRTQSNICGAYSKATGSRDFAVFFALETNPKVPGPWTLGQKNRVTLRPNEFRARP